MDQKIWTVWYFLTWISPLFLFSKWVCCVHYIRLGISGLEHYMVHPIMWDISNDNSWSPLCKTTCKMKHDSWVNFTTFKLFSLFYLKAELCKLFQLIERGLWTWFLHLVRYSVLLKDPASIKLDDKSNSSIIHQSELIESRVACG